MNSISGLTEISSTGVRVVLVGTISNVALQLKSDIQKISEALSDNELFQIILVESDSTDSTIDIADALANLDNRIELISLGNLKEKIPDRVERIRYCRQVYVQRLREIQKSCRIDYVVVADMDGMNSSISKESVNRSIRFEGWDVALSNQWLGYYDLLALRHPTWMPGNCFEEYYRAREELFSTKRFWGNVLGRLFAYYLSDRLKVKHIYSRMIRVPRATQIIEVESGFGGFGIYRARVFMECDYTIPSKDFLGECEHISLSRQIRERGYTISIHPWMINSYWNTYNINKISIIRHLRALKRVINIPVVRSEQST